MHPYTPERHMLENARDSIVNGPKIFRTALKKTFIWQAVRYVVYVIISCLKLTSNVAIGVTPEVTS